MISIISPLKAYLKSWNHQIFNVPFELPTLEFWPLQMTNIFMISNRCRSYFQWPYPLVICDIAIEHGPFEIVDLPNLKLGGFSSSLFKNVYYGKSPTVN